jgi:hypothetical protein
MHRHGKRRIYNLAPLTSSVLALKVSYTVYEGFDRISNYV